MAACQVSAGVDNMFVQSQVVFSVFMQGFSSILKSIINIIRLLNLGCPFQCMSVVQSIECSINNPQAPGKRGMPICPG